MKSTIRITCGDGVVRLQREYFDKSIFNNPDIAKADSYTLQCKARVRFVSDLVDLVEGEPEKLTITEDNYNELRSLCKELGFRGLDEEFRAFRGKSESRFVDIKEFLQLREQVKRQDKRLVEIERRLGEVLRWKQETRESVSQFHSLERKVENFGRDFAERNACAHRRMEPALWTSVRQSDLKEFSRDAARLKEMEKRTATKSPVTTETAVQIRPGRSLDLIEAKRSALPPLKQAVPATPAPPIVKQKIECGYKGGFFKKEKKLDGIIAHLTRECGGNVNDKGIVHVMASGIDEVDYHQKNAADLGTDSTFRSNDEPNSWICYSFKDRRVIPTSYSVRSGKSHPLKFWVIEGSNDGRSWTEIDRQENNNDLNDKYGIVNFKISNVPSEGFRFFRLRQTGKNHDGDGCLEVSSLEIFGTLLVTERTEQPRQEFVYHADREGQLPPPLFPPKLDGVIAYLTREFGGNVHDRGIVNVLGTGRRLREVVELVCTEFSCECDCVDSWICYDFNNRRVIPRSYSVTSCDWGPGWDHLKSWVIEVSNDRTSWTEIDRRENNNDLNNRYVTVNFQISKVPIESFRFFRLRQTGKNHRGKDGFIINAMDIFGTLLVTERIEQPRQEFVYRADREGQSPPPLSPPKFDGVIEHLTFECGGNVHDKGFVHVTGSSVWDSSSHPKNVTDFRTDSSYKSNDEKNAWICYNFKERRVIPTSYSVRSCKDSPGGNSLKSWVIELSNDGRSWTEIDRQENNNDLNDKFAVCIFTISKVPSEGFRFFRLRQTGKNHHGNDYLEVSSLEIFGTLLVTERIEQPRQEFVYQANRERRFPPPLFPPKLDGVIAYLTCEFGGNVHDRGIVNVTASSVYNDCQPKNAVDLVADSCYRPKDEKEAWICYDFRERRVLPTSYSLRLNGYHPESWVMEVSNDGTKNSWTEIDRQDFSYRFDSIENFRIYRVPSEGFRFFRLRSNNSDYIELSSLEIFGILIKR